MYAGNLRFVFHIRAIHGFHICIICEDLSKCVMHTWHFDRGITQLNNLFVITGDKDSMGFRIYEWTGI